MRAALVTDFGGPEVVQIMDVEVPQPAVGQVRIKVAAAALNPADAIVRSGAAGDIGRPFGLGWDVAGTIDSTGPDTPWAIGDKVIALHASLVKPTGTHADYVVVDATAVAAAPASVDPVHAATLPLNALTADQALDLLKLAHGQTLLVTGAAGAVGGYAVQLATRKGIAVTALAGHRDEHLVRQLGAARFVARGSEPGPHDAVLDTATLGAPALEWVRNNGAYLGVSPQAQPQSLRGIQTRSVVVVADGARLKELVALVDAGKLTTRVAQTYALEDAAKAHAHLAQHGVRERLVLVPNNKTHT